jgi:hypothetical protein
MREDPRMRAFWSSLLVVGGVCLLVPVRSHAQPLFGYAESLESTVANADLVVLGKLVEFEDAGQDDEREVHEAAIAVEETLKQDVFTLEPYRRLRVHVRGPASDLANWKVHAHRLLVAVKDDEAPNESTVIDLKRGEVEVLTADLQLLRDPDAVVQIARETVRRMPVPVKRIHTFALVVPRKTVVGTKWEKYYEAGGHLFLSVPVDERLEKRARDDIRSESYMNREQGVRALRYFKSDENLARVRRLLNDPGWAYLRHPEENHGVEVRLYGVRQEAYRTLKSWNVDVREPMIREEVRK